MLKTALAGAAILVIYLLYAAASPWIKKHGTPSDACSRWSDGAVILHAPFLSNEGYAYIVPSLAGVKSQSDDSAHPARSTAILCEDDSIVGAAHSVHDDITKAGNGRYSHWAGALYFSTSDHSDPNTNGRRYKLVFPPLWYRLLLQ
jgi:hypothetical protein